MTECQLTFVERGAIDFALACRQHEEYCRVLRECGAEVRLLDVNLDLPDCAFIEDAAVVLDEAAIIGRMGTEARRPETAGIESELAALVPVHRIEAPATLEGGDVLRIGHTLLVGRSSRTNAAGVSALSEFAGRYGYEVRPVPVHGCLHLKTACTALPDGRLLVNRDWLDCDGLEGFDLLDVPADEPWGANIACLGSADLNPHYPGAVVCAAAGSPRTAELICGLGFEVRTVDLSEFAKAEGGVTCLSIVLPG